jgi:hypothetical protein
MALLCVEDELRVRAFSARDLSEESFVARKASDELEFPAELEP